MTNLTDNMRGALLMMCSMAAFTFGDTCIKLTGGALPLSQLLVMRGVLASALIALIVWWFGAFRLSLPRRDWGLIGLRTGAEIGAAYFFLTALFHMPLANVSALLQTLPLTVTLGGALVFGEAVGWRRWLAIVVGFVGMLLIVRPGTEGFDANVVYALASVVCVTVRDLTTRRISRATPSLMVTLAASVGVTLFAGFATTGQPWAPVDLRLAALIGAAALLICGGYLFSVLVMRVGEVSFVAPFRYTSLIWALVLGYLVFGDWPQPLTLIGAAIIVSTGLYTLYREGLARRRAAAARRP